MPKHESGEMEVYSSTQALMDAQHWVAQVFFISRRVSLNLFLIPFEGYWCTQK